MNALRVLIVLSVTLLFSSGLSTDRKFIFEDDFSSDVLDKRYWNYELGDGCPTLCGWGNKEYQAYTQDNVSVKDNQLIITATEQNGKYFSGRITTKDKMEFKYGTVEVRAKLPKGLGVWPAIWMLGHDIDDIHWPSCGEIDIMEYVGRMPNKIHTTLHTQDSHGTSINTKITTIENIEEGFHVYKMDWDAEKIQFFIDDHRVYTFAPDNKTADIWPFNKPFYLIVNLAVGGHFGGFEVDDSIFPQEFIIDYIKVYE